MAEETRDGTPSATLLSEVAGSLGRVIEGELRLARAEAGAAMDRAKRGLVKVAVAAILGLVGLNVLAGAAVAGLAATGMGAGAAGLVVALVLFGTCAALVLSARAALRLGNLVPRRAFRGLARDVRAVEAGLNRKGAHHV